MAPSRLPGSGGRPNLSLYRPECIPKACRTWPSRHRKTRGRSCHGKKNAMLWGWRGSGAVRWSRIVGFQGSRRRTRPLRGKGRLSPGSPCRKVRNFEQIVASTHLLSHCRGVAPRPLAPGASRGLLSQLFAMRRQEVPRGGCQYRNPNWRQRPETPQEGRDARSLILPPPSVTRWNQSGRTADRARPS